MKRFLPLFLVAAGVAAPASAQMTPGKIWGTYSWGQVKQAYDEDGNAEDTGSTATIQRVGIGTSYNLMQIGDAALWLGAEFALGALKNDVEAVSGESYEVGFKPQNLSIMTGFRAPMYGFQAGFMADIGSDLKVNSGSDVELPNSDGSNAVVLGGNVNYPAGAVRLTAGVDYYLTLKQDRQATLTTATPGLAGTYVLDYESDPSDYIDGYVGAGYNVTPSFEIGLQARWLQRTEGTAGNVTATGGSAQQNQTLAAAINAGLVSVPTVADETEGNALGLVPYLKYTAATMPLTLKVSGSTTREYAPYGLTLMGKDSPVGRTGVTVGLSYGF